MQSLVHKTWYNIVFQLYLKKVWKVSLFTGPKYFGFPFKKPFQICTGTNALHHLTLLISM